MASHTLCMIAVVSLSLAACGDDADDGGSNDTESSSSGDSSGAPATTMPATTMAMDGSSSSGGADTSSDGGSGGSGSGDTSVDSGTGPMPGSESGSGTGAAGACGELDMKACDMDEACLWVGNPNNGMCIGAGERACELIEMEQVCTANPVCVWDKDAMTCGGA